MKTIEEIEKMSLEDLEAASSGNEVEVPPGLRERIEDSLTACTISGENNHGRGRAWRWCLGACAAAACTVIALRVHDPVKDTFSDPMEAYAEVEKAFAIISSTMAKGIEQVSEDGGGALRESTARLIRNCGQGFEQNKE